MIRTIVGRTWLACRPPSSASAPTPSAPVADVALTRRLPCTVAEYRALYAGVGARFQWRERDAWSDARLAAWLARPDVHVWVLEQGGRPAGYFELHHEPDGRVELVYFGLVMEAQGRGLGRWMLERAQEEAWRLRASVLWLHTCTLDGDAALPNYRARGFRPFRTETYDTVCEPPEAR